MKKQVTRLLALCLCLCMACAVVPAGYALDAADVPVIDLKFPTLSFEEDVKLNIYFAVSDLTNVSEMGLILYKNAPSDWNIDNAEVVTTGYHWSDSEELYYVTSDGIAAKDLGETVNFAVYALLSDGSYCYSELVSYSPEEYARTQIANGTEEMKKLMIAMLNYGAEAQLYFSYNTDKLANRNLTDDQKAMVESYRSDMVAPLPEIEEGAIPKDYYEGRIISRSRTVSFESSFVVTYYLEIDRSDEFYMIRHEYGLDFWTEETFEANKGTLELLYSRVSTYYPAEGKEITDDALQCYMKLSGIAAKELNKPFYVALECNYCDPNIERWYAQYADLQNYSIGTYCNNIIARGDAMAPLAAATVVYGHYASLYFA